MVTSTAGRLPSRTTFEEVPMHAQPIWLAPVRNLSWVAARFGRG